MSDILGDNNIISKNVIDPKVLNSSLSQSATLYLVLLNQVCRAEFFSECFKLASHIHAASSWDSFTTNRQLCYSFNCFS